MSTELLNAVGEADMAQINDIAQQVISKGYLSLEDERKMRSLMSQKNYDLDDFKAFMNLQWAVMDRRVKQESLEQLKSCYINTPPQLSV